MLPFPVSHGFCLARIEMVLETDIIHTLPHVGRVGLCVLQEVCGVIVGGCLSEHAKISGGQTVLECL